jgi:HSP20 family protein
MFLRRDSMQDIYREVNRLQDEMGRLFGRAGRSVASAFGMAAPAVNVWEDAEHVFAEADLPGVDPAKLDVSVTDQNQLTIQGERPVVEVPNSVWHRQERPAGTFARLVTLPSVVNPERVEAAYDSGVLRIKLAKAEAAKPRKITVKSV